MLNRDAIACYPLDMDERLPGTVSEAAETRLINALLSPDERLRAARLRLPGQGRRWSRVRVRLRQLLGERLGTPAAELSFVAGTHGKPVLAYAARDRCRTGGEPSWHFSVSHAGRRALIALSPAGALGVDIERISDTRDTAALAETVFSESERRAFAARPPAQRATLFTQVWVRKEALVKATGTGIGFGLARVQVGCEATPRLLIDAEPVAAWTLLDLEAPPGYRAALCCAT